MERIKEVLISPKMSIRQALKKMDQAGEKILFVTDSNGAILGVVTDGNIRRWILRNGSLTETISKAMNTNPITLRENYDIKDVKELMLKKQIECIPILGDKNRIVSALWWREIFGNVAKPKKKINLPVVIMAGGEGTRLFPFTKVLPKPLMLIGDKPISELIMERFSEYGCRKIFFSVNYKSNIVKAYFDDFEHPYIINYIKETKPLGTAGSIGLLKNKIKTTVFVSNCDILIEADYSDILEFHRKNNNKITLVGSMKHFTIAYGVCKTGKSGKLNRIEEKPEYDFLVNTGMYVLEPDVLRKIPVDRQYHMTELINSYMARNEKVGVYPISEKSWLDIGQMEELKNTLKKFGVE